MTVARSELGAEEVRASALGRLLHESGERHSRSGADTELERLLITAGASRSEEKRTAWRVWALAAAAVALLGIGGSFAWHQRGDAPLTFRANGVLRHEPVAIAAEAGRAVDLAFSDGSVFNMEPAARLRVDSSSASGARLTLVAGKTVAHVVHRAKTSWSVSAGPFEVRVTGTRFGASWDDKRERLSVELYEGSVEVTGGGFSAPISVRAGQRLEAGKVTGDWLLTSLEGPTSAFASTSSAEPASGASPPFPNEPSSVRDPSTNVPSGPTSSGRSASTLDWPALLGRADFEGIVREANDFGIERCLSTCAPSDLRMLADSARYLGRYALAESSLLALRKRSPSDAPSAAFLLGRLDESRNPRDALSWYGKSLDEAPGGAYAAEAWAGKMRMLLKTAGPAAAAPAAAQYLERFPRGVHAARAREILSQVESRSDRR